jgi:hypothetical protein
MFVFSRIFSNSSTGSRPYCVWVPVHENGRDRLISIWIDPARTAFESRPQQASRGIDATATPFGPKEKTDVDQRDALDMHKVLPFCS